MGNVVEAEKRFDRSPPVANSNENSKLYTKFIVINWHTNALMAMSDEDLVDNATYLPVNFVEFLEMSNHGKFDSMDKPHLIVLQPNGERTTMAIVIAATLQ
jgi:hypothetical protein